MEEVKETPKMEIKFRIWDIKAKKLLPVSQITFKERRKFSVIANGVEYSDEEVILSQFTGVKDKQGLDIYIGDTFKFSMTKEETIVMQVIFYQGCFVLSNEQYVHYSSPIKIDLYNAINFNSVVRINNIYEDEV